MRQTKTDETKGQMRKVDKQDKTGLMRHKETDGTLRAS